MSEKFDGRESADKSSFKLESVRSSVMPGSVRSAVLATLLFSGCAGQQEASSEPTTPPLEPTTTEWTATLGLPPVKSDANRACLIGDMVINMTIFGKVGKEPWPGVATTCLFTGIVLEYDRLHVPPRIMLENMCLQKRDGTKNVFEGQHLWSEADVHGHFKVPFQRTHIEEKKGRLIFVTEFEGNRIERDLIPGDYEPGTLSFAHSLDRYHVLSIKN